MPQLVMSWKEGNPWGEPRRGDVLRFPRTCYWVFGVKRVKTRDGSLRFKCWCEAQQYVEVELQARLRRSALRGRGQVFHECFWNPREKKRPAPLMP